MSVCLWEIIAGISGDDPEIASYYQSSVTAVLVNTEGLVHHHSIFDLTNNLQEWWSSSVPLVLVFTDFYWETDEEVKKFLFCLFIYCDGEALFLDSVRSKSLAYFGVPLIYHHVEYVVAFTTGSASSRMSKEWKMPHCPKKNHSHLISPRNITATWQLLECKTEPGIKNDHLFIFTIHSYLFFNNYDNTRF